MNRFGVRVPRWAPHIGYNMLLCIVLSLLWLNISLVNIRCLNIDARVKNDWNNLAIYTKLIVILVMPLFYPIIVAFEK